MISTSSRASTGMALALDIYSVFNSVWPKIQLVKLNLDYTYLVFHEFYIRNNRVIWINVFWFGSLCTSVLYLCGAFDLFHHWQVYLSHLLAFWRLPWQRLTFACIFRRNGLRSSSRKIHSFRKIHSTVRPIFPLAHGRSTLKIEREQNFVLSTSDSQIEKLQFIERSCTKLYDIT